MSAKHLKKSPKPLLDDLVAGRWLPVIGAGFSRNATLLQEKAMPLWSGLGDLLATHRVSVMYTRLPLRDRNVNVFKADGVLAKHKSTKTRKAYGIASG
jgi:hypothetical protein